jgi:hypothetical protein
MSIKKNIGELEFVASSGTPLMNAGYLPPIFRKNGNYFECGGKTFNQRTMDEIIEDEAGILFKPVIVSDRINESNLFKTHERSGHYSLNAFVMFFSEQVIKSIGKKNIINLSKINDGIPVYPVDRFGDYGDFFLFEREPLIEGFIPQIIEECKEGIDFKIKERRESKKYSQEIVSDEEDEIAQLAKVMMNIASKETIEPAVQYYGKTLLLSPMKRNFNNWLNFVCSRWNLEEDRIRREYFS